MVLSLVYLLPMLLGRTIDLKTYTFSGSIYDYENYVEVPDGTMNSTYYVLQDDNFPYASFGLPIDIVLRVKSDYLNTISGSMGLTGFLKDTSWKYKSVLVAVVTMYKTVSRSLMENATVLPDWKDKIPWSQTHFADGITYGAWCIVLFKLNCDIPGDIHTVRRTITQNLGETGQFGNDTVDSWKKALKAIEENKDIRGKVQVSTSVYSTVPLGNFITTPESYVEELEGFKNLVKPPGQPLFMHLNSIHSIDKGYRDVEENHESFGDLEKIDGMFDDLKATKDNIIRWTTATEALFSDEDEARIYSLLEKINSATRSFRKVTEDVSLYKEIDREGIDLAFHSYLIGLDKGMGTYNLAYMKLKEEIDAGCEDSFLYKIKGLLKVYDNEMVKKGEVKGGLEECQKYCIEDERCRAVGYASHLSRMDLSTSLFIREENQCWIYYRSTNTAIIDTSPDITGDMGIYDRKCYV